MRDPFSRMLDLPAPAARGLAGSGRDTEESEVVDALCREVSRFCAARLDARRIDRDEPHPRALVSGLAELGAFGLTVPAEHGGGGLSMRGATRVVREIARADGSLATTVGLHLGLALRALVAHGSAALRERWLPEVAAGRAIACFGATEPEAGSDVSAVRTRAALRGDVLVVDGEKIFVTNGGIASFVTALCSTPGLGGAARGTSLVLVDLASPGVRRGREEKKLGLKGSSTVAIHFEGVQVPPSSVLGEAGRGLDVLGEALVWGRTFLAAGCLGNAEGALATARDHCATRRQFGRTLDGFEAVRAHLARMDAQVRAMEAALAVVTALEDARPGSTGWESAAAKVFCSEAAWDVADTALQLHGGVGYVEETGIARRLRDARVTRIFEGANDVLRLHLSAGALAWRRDDLAALPHLVSRVAPELQGEAAAFDVALRRTIEALLDARKRHGVRIHERQLLQCALADALVALFVWMSAILRARSEDLDPTVAVGRLARRGAAEALGRVRDSG